MTRLRLFPLRTVLFPGMELPLQVFEERYRTLVAECLETQEPFGVALIRNGPEVGGRAEPYSMGCTAQLRRVSPTRDGRLQVQATGGRRFRTVRLHEDRPYLSAEVEYPVDESAEVPADRIELAAERLRQLHHLRDTIAGQYRREVEVPMQPGALADEIGGSARGLVTERQLQQLLSALNVRRRFDLADEMLTALVSATHQQAAAVVAQRWARPERRN